MSDFIMLTNVRVSFPHLFTPPVISGETGKCGAILMLEPGKQAPLINAIEKEIAAVQKDKFKGRKLPSDKLCLRDGEDKGRPEYDGYSVLSANSRKAPIVIAANGQTVIASEENSPIYAGCFVNAKVRLWGQDNTYGKRVNAELVSIQFACDGEPLDTSYVSVDDAVDGFGAVGDEEDDFLAA